MPKANEVNINDFSKFYELTQGNHDVFTQKIRVIDLRKQDGKQKVDKEGNPILDEFGVIQKWDDSYYLIYIPVNCGVKHTTRITQEQFTSLEIGVTYIADGYVDYVLYKDAFNSTPTINFTNFLSEKEWIASQLQIFKSEKTAPNA